MTASTTTDSNIPSVLQRIVATKQLEVAAAKEQRSLAQLQAKAEKDTQPRRGFANALRAADIGNEPRLLKGLSITISRPLYLPSNTSRPALVVYPY